MINRGVVIFVLCSVMAARAAGLDNGDTTSPIKYRQNSKGEVVELSGLFRGCDPGTREPEPLVGRVVKRLFADDAIHIQGFVVEDAGDGTRINVNVDPIPDDLSMALISAVVPVLQRLLREGRTIHALIRRCGVTGRTLVLEQVQ